MPMHHSNYPGGFANGVTIRNMPVLNAYGGNVFWVHSAAALVGNQGTFVRPCTTIDAAVSLCTASRGDIIVCKPGHAESIANATTFQLDKAGIAVVGLGTGALRPTFSFTNTAGSVEVDSASCLLQNLRFVADVSAVVVGINVDANDCGIVGCEFDFVDTGDDFLIYVDCGDVDGTFIEGSRFIAEIADGSNEAIRMDNCDRTRIVGNYIYGDFALAAIYGDTTGDTGDGANVSREILISGNNIFNADTVLGIAIDLNSADLGVISYNNLGTAGPSTPGVSAALDPGSCRCIENYAVSAVDNCAVVVPQTADT